MSDIQLGFLWLLFFFFFHIWSGRDNHFERRFQIAFAFVKVCKVCNLPLWSIKECFILHLSWISVQKYFVHLKDLEPKMFYSVVF